MIGFMLFTNICFKLSSYIRFKFIQFKFKSWLAPIIWRESLLNNGNNTFLLVHSQAFNHVFKTRCLFWSHFFIFHIGFNYNWASICKHRSSRSLLSSSSSLALVILPYLTWLISSTCSRRLGVSWRRLFLRFWCSSNFTLVWWAGVLILTCILRLSNLLMSCWVLSLRYD